VAREVQGIMAMIASTLSEVPAEVSAPADAPDQQARSCSNCLRLEAELQTAKARIESLEKRLQQLESELRRGKRQAAPFARDQKKKKTRKRPGRRPGEGKFSHREKPADSLLEETLVVPLPCCPCCGDEALKDMRTLEQYEVDIPPITPRWRRFLFHSAYCGTCKQRVFSRHPEQVSLATGAAGVVIGARAKALAADLKHRLGVPLGKSAELLRTAFGLEVTASGLCQANARLAETAVPLYSQIAQRLAEAAAVGADDTGWRIGGLPAYLWVFTCPEATLYAVDRRRSHVVPLEILGEDFAGVLTSDCAPAFDHHRLSPWRQQKCWAHLRKDLRALEEESSNRQAVRFVRAVNRIYTAAQVLASQRERLSPLCFAARQQEVEAELDRWLQRPPGRDPRARRMGKRLRKQRDHLFTFLEDAAVPATNNLSERMLRPGVITRKTGGCNRSARGARTHEILASVLVTLRQQGREILHFLQALLCAPATIPDLFPVPAPQSI
jgi:transposase